MKKLSSPVWIHFDVTVDSVFAPNIHLGEDNTEKPGRDIKEVFF